MGDAITARSAEEIEALKDHSKILASSGLLPDHFKKTPSAVYTCIGLAQSMGEDPVMLMQNCFFIGGKMGLHSSYLLSRLRRKRVIKGTLKYIVEGQGDTLSVRATGIDAETGEVVTGPAATMEMARLEGWTKNPKYKSIPEIMLTNRSIAFFVRYKYPDVTGGLAAVEELQDVQAAQSEPAVRTGALAQIEASLVNGERVEAAEEDAEHAPEPGAMDEPDPFDGVAP